MNKESERELSDKGTMWTKPRRPRGPGLVGNGWSTGPGDGKLEGKGYSKNKRKVRAGLERVFNANSIV